MMPNTSHYERPSWDDYFMGIARLVSERSTCLRRRVGAVLVKDRCILSTGYNGPPTKLPHCNEVGCIREQLHVPSGEKHELCRGLHAEQNAIIQAAVHGVAIMGSELYCTHHPCSICTKMIINAGIVKILYLDGYSDALAQDLFKTSAIQIVQHNKHKGEDFGLS